MVADSIIKRLESVLPISGLAGVCDVLAERFVSCFSDPTWVLTEEST